jgi:hypothetical protein
MVAFLPSGIEGIAALLLPDKRVQLERNDGKRTLVMPPANHWRVDAKAA